ncbi:unnamed protein product [Clavelina lepadiformis]|uniref:Uncharacterized protein n=1 Tax=Clavelina lepadiformis TaxID=159417 RepID=A0ABP0FFR8_CLALP
MTNVIKGCGSTLSVFYLSKYHPRRRVSFSPMNPLTARHFAAGDCSGKRFDFRVFPPRYYIPYLPLSSVPSSTAKVAKVSTEDDFKTKAS